jgi:PhnB protein
MRFDPYLYFDGACREAFEFYQRATGGTLTTMMTYGESPMAAAVGAATADKIIHATLMIDGSALLGSDAMPGRYRPPQGFAVTMQADTPEAAERIFAGLSDGAEIVMPLQETFWTRRFGQLTDRFGIGWMLNCD